MVSVSKVKVRACAVVGAGASKRISPRFPHPKVYSQNAWIYVSTQASKHGYSYVRIWDLDVDIYKRIIRFSFMTASTEFVIYA